MAKKGKKGAEPVQEVESDSDWDDGAKKPSKKQLEQEAKKQAQSDKKKEREALLEMEESSIKSKKGGKTKSHKKGGLDDALNQFDVKGSISADGLDDSLAALTLLKKDAVTNKDLDRHPERRFKAALAEYTESRLPELKKEHPGLRKQQMEQMIYKEFQKSPANPFNQETNIDYNATNDDVTSKKKEIRDKRSKKFER